MGRIRTATEDDLIPVVEMGRAMHLESPRYQKLGYEEDKAFVLAQEVTKRGGLFVAERDDLIIGMMGGFVVEHFFSYELVASDYVLYIKPEYRNGTTAIRLIREFEKWAESKGAVEIVLGVSTGVHMESTLKLYESLGYAYYAGSAFKRIKRV